MTDTARVRELLREIASMTEPHSRTTFESTIHDKAQAALSALSDDAGDWTVGELCSYGYPIIAGGRTVGYAMERADACRFARIPRIERKAGRVLQQVGLALDDPTTAGVAIIGLHALRDLAAALKESNHG